MPDPATAAAPGLWSTTDEFGHPISTRFLTALAASQQQRVVRIDVYNLNTYLATLDTYSDGAVTVDYTATTRRTLTVTVNSQGLPIDDLVPVKAGDLLHPASGNELHVYRGFQYSDGSQDLCQLGVFRMTKPVVTDTGNGITVSITGYDRSAYISRLAWTQPYTIPANTDLATAIKDMLQNRWIAVEPLDYSKLTSTSPIPDGYTGAGQYISVPTTTFGTELADSNDPWSDMYGLAVDAGMDLHFDVYGNPVLIPVVATSGLSSSFDGLYEEGTTATFNQVAKTLDETSTYNGVLAIGTGTAGNDQNPPVNPVQSQTELYGQTYPGIWNMDPTSPTYYDPSQPELSDWGPVPYVYETSSIPGYASIPLMGQTQADSAEIVGVVSASGGSIPPELQVGSPITGDPEYIPSGATVVSFTSNSIQMSSDAVSTSNGSINLTGGGLPDTQYEAQTKINAVATALLVTLQSTLDESSFNAVPNPALWENDVVSVLRARIGTEVTTYGVDSAVQYVVQGVTIPLDVETAMSVTCRPQAAAT